jgi:hypothetical protein
MKRGTIVILIILVVALAAAGASLVYHYRNQRRAQQFWGTTTAVLIDRAPQVEVLELGEPGQDIALDAGDSEQPAAGEKGDDGDAPQPASARKAVEFNQVPWIVLKSKDAAAAKGIANLRRALVLDTTYDWSKEAAADDPHWQYGVAISDGKNWAAVLFDFDSRQVGLTGGRKTALLDPEANAEFRQFFAEQFPKAEEPTSEPRTKDQPKADEKRE